MATLSSDFKHILRSVLWTIVFTVITLAEKYVTCTCVQVYTKQASVLVASITCVSCRDNNQFTISSSQVIKLVGSCVDCSSQDTVYRWTVIREDGVTLPINLATTTTGHDRRNLVVRSSVIDAGYSYRFVADCLFAFLR